MPNHALLHPVTILIAEDDDGHAELIQDILRDAGVTNPIRRFRDGQEVLDHLGLGAGAEIEEGGRYLLLLDIRMPRVDGVEVLRRVKGSEQLKSIPVIMLTTTDDPREIQGSYDAGCNFYISKPVDFGRFTAVLRQIGLFLMVVQVPKVPEA